MGVCHANFPNVLCTFPPSPISLRKCVLHWANAGSRGLPTPVSIPMFTQVGLNLTQANQGSSFVVFIVEHGVRQMGVIYGFGSQIPRLSGQPLHVEASEHTNLAQSRREGWDKDVKTEFRCHSGKSVLGMDLFFPIYFWYTHSLFVCLFVSAQADLSWASVTCTQNSDICTWGMNLWGADGSGIGHLLSFLCVQYWKSTRSVGCPQMLAGLRLRLPFPFAWWRKDLRNNITLYKRWWRFPTGKDQVRGI